MDQTSGAAGNADRVLFIAACGGHLQTRWPTEIIRVDGSAVGHAGGRIPPLSLRVTSAVPSRIKALPRSNVLFISRSSHELPKPVAAIARECRRATSPSRGPVHARIFLYYGEVIKPVRKRKPTPENSAATNSTKADGSPAIEQAMPRRYPQDSGTRRPPSARACTNAVGNY